ncbi:hypothetical protein [Halioxenophilus sp. WMMB6]|uniref:hypothetical protein n=1 Tax=Halioxenophilus sp. WMMB6 TaxID=3073815 RepID=UPI00295F3F7C|nr:hypothetical protein [Halioxenophilus sp. WMMB6]
MLTGLFLLVLAILWRLLLPAGSPSANQLTQVVSRGEIENSISAAGTLEPKHYVEESAQVSDQVQKMLVEEGEEVTAGQLLVSISLYHSLGVAPEAADT